MAVTTWTITSVEDDLYLDHLKVGPSDVGGTAKNYSVEKRTLRGGLRDGVDIVEIDNGVLSFVVVPTRGMGLWKAWTRDLHLGWVSPVQGPVHPKMVRLDEASGIGWLDGFDELLVRCGLESNGAPEFDDKGRLVHGLHGKIGNTPAHTVELTVDGNHGIITLEGVVDEARLFGNKLRMTTTITTWVGRPEISISDTVENLSAEPGELELLYHFNIGVPLVGPGARAVLPVMSMCPRDQTAVENLANWNQYGPETPGAREAVFFFDLAADSEGWTQTLLRGPRGDRGVSLRFNKQQLPCFTLWKNREAAADGYVTGMEPGINFPNTKSFERRQGRVATLEPGEQRTFELTITAHTTPDSVAEAEQAVAELQGDTAPDIMPVPDVTWAME